MSDWKTIDESPATEPIVLRGVPVTAPEAYERIYGRKGGWFHLAAIAAGLWRVTAWSASILGHLILMIVLISILISKPADRENLVSVSMEKGDRGEHGKLLAEAMPEPAPEPEPEPPKEEPKKEEKKEEEKKEEPKEVAKEEEVKKEEPKEEPAVKNETPKEEPKKDDTIGKGSGELDKKNDQGKDTGKDIEVDPTQATASRRAGDLAKLRRGGDKQIVVVAGAYDQVERVLTTLGIPHTRIEHGELGTYDLADCIVLLVNCHTALAKMTSSGGNAAKMKQEADRLAKEIGDLEKKLEKAQKDLEDATTEGRRTSLRRTIRDLESEISSKKLSKTYYEKMYNHYSNASGLVDNVRKFVEKGGYLFTSDWGLTLLEKLYPDLVANGGNYGPSEVKIVPKSERDEPRLLDGVFVKPSKPGTTTTTRDLRWEIDSGSYLIRVKSNRVKTVVESSQLPNHKAVAVVFQPTDESGRVLHVLSHFSKQADNYGEYALQNLLLNFVLERFEKKAP